jgi:hypothetical protein
MLEWWLIVAVSCGNFPCPSAWVLMPNEEVCRSLLPLNPERAQCVAKIPEPGPK